VNAEGRLRQAERRAREAVRAATTTPTSDLWMPRIGEFITGSEFLSIGSIYPRQLTLLKLLFLETDELTAYDYGVIDEWTSDFKLVEAADGTRRYEGRYGTPPDVLARAERCRAEGRPWFHDVIAPMGRRAGKGFLMSISCAAVLWWLFCRPEGPHRFLHVAPTKRLNISVFAGKKDQAIGNLWRDIVDVILNSPCYAPFVAQPPRGSDTLLLYTPDQLREDATPDPDRALIEIVARETTRLAGRGPASVALFFDEMAYLMASGLSRSADEVYSAAAPANAQFGRYGFIGQVSSPWQRLDRFYQNYEAALRVDTAGNAIHHDTLVMQLPSWDMYRDWELTK